MHICIKAIQIYNKFHESVLIGYIVMVVFLYFHKSCNTDAILTNLVRKHIIATYID